MFSTAAVSRASAEGGGAGAGVGVAAGGAAGIVAGVVTGGGGADDDRINGARSTGGRLVVIVADDDDGVGTGGWAGASTVRAGGVDGGSGGTKPRAGGDVVPRPDLASALRAGGVVTRAGGVLARSRALSLGSVGVFSAGADAWRSGGGGTIAAPDGVVAASDVNTVGAAGGGVTTGRVRSGSLAADCVTVAGCLGSRWIHHARPSKATDIAISATAAVRAHGRCVRIQVTGENGWNDVCGGGAMGGCGTSTHIAGSVGPGRSCGNSASQSCGAGFAARASGPSGGLTSFGAGSAGPAASRK